MKLYDLGLVIGRFQILHNGHVSMIKHALEMCDRVVVFIGSSQKQGTSTNPFSFYVRQQMIEKVFSVETSTNKLLIRPLPDIGLGNNDMWGSYVMGVFEEEFGKQPDLYVTGCEKERASWFTNEIAPHMDELRISRGVISCSASECRKALLENNSEYWKQHIPYQLHKDIDFYTKILRGVKDE